MSDTREYSIGRHQDAIKRLEERGTRAEVVLIVEQMTRRAAGYTNPTAIDLSYGQKLSVARLQLLLFGPPPHVMRVENAARALLNLPADAPLDQTKQSVRDALYTATTVINAAGYGA